MDGLQAGLDAAQAAFEEGHQAASDLLGTSRGVFFSAAIAAAVTGTRSITPVDAIDKKGGGRDIGKSMTEKLAALKAENDLQVALTSGDKARVREMQTALEIEKALTVEMRKQTPELAAQIEGEIKRKHALQIALEVCNTWKSVGEQVTQTIWDNFMKVGEGSMKFGDALKQSLVQMIKLVAQAAILKPLMNSIRSSFGSAGSSIFGGGSSGGGIFSSLFGGSQSQGTSASGWSTSVSTPGFFGGFFENGGAFDHMGQVKMFADGGVVNGATALSYGGSGLGVLGERGPEAFMPLERGSNGKLGVRAAGGGGQSNITFAPTFHVAGDLSENTRAGLMQDMQSMLASARPGMIRDAKQVVRHETVNNPNYLKRSSPNFTAPVARCDIFQMPVNTGLPSAHRAPVLPRGRAVAPPQGLHSTSRARANDNRRATSRLRQARCCAHQIDAATRHARSRHVRVYGRVQ